MVRGDSRRSVVLSDLQTRGGGIRFLPGEVGFQRRALVWRWLIVLCEIPVFGWRTFFVTRVAPALRGLLLSCGTVTSG
jgi:hypothetical protein